MCFEISEVSSKSTTLALPSRICGLHAAFWTTGVVEIDEQVGRISVCVQHGMVWERFCHVPVGGRPARRPLLPYKI